MAKSVPALAAHGARVKSVFSVVVEALVLNGSQNILGFR
jgi:hypothetical protein